LIPGGSIEPVVFYTPVLPDFAPHRKSRTQILTLIMKNLLSLLTSSRLMAGAAAAATLIFTTSCASLETGRPSTSILPIETKSSAPGVVVSARAFERGGKLFVAGSWKKTPGYALHYASHVDIELLSRNGSVIASVRDEIEPAPAVRTKIRNTRVAFVGSFPAETARNADRIRIVAHAHETL
jgi:hypothetical protein